MRSPFQPTDRAENGEAFSTDRQSTKWGGLFNRLLHLLADDLALSVAEVCEVDLLAVLSSADQALSARLRGFQCFLECAGDVLHIGVGVEACVAGRVLLLTLCHSISGLN